jgi:predicted FMN-binding regulatory protein PaiB
LIFYGNYSDIPPDAVDAFVREAEMGRLVTVGEQDMPHIGLYPFVYMGSHVEMHLHRKDEQFADLGVRTKCVFVIPSYWIHPEDAAMATAYYRTVIFECEATVSADAPSLAAQQTRLMERYQPQGDFRPIAAEDPLYTQAISHIAAVRLTILNRRVKFKLGQNRALEVRAKIVEELRRRGRPADGRAADALQWTIDQESGRQS